MKFLVVLTAALLLSGCMSLSRSQQLTALPEDWSRGGRVDEVTLNYAPELKVTPQFESIFKARVKAKLVACATGARPLRLDASLSRLDKANPILTTLVAGANVMRGTANLVDLESGKPLANYNIGQTVVGGRVAIIKMGQAEEQMSDAFGDELCKLAFAAPSARP
jgi:hypothetical protein